MNEIVTELRTNIETCYIRQEGLFLGVYNNRGCLSFKYRINIRLFYMIALYTSVRRSYKRILQEFFDGLKEEGINHFRSRETLARACNGCGRHGGSATAYRLGLFCRYYGKLPRNINVVLSACENCTPSACGSKNVCGDYFGCGEGVLSPLESGFNVGDIPRLREEIRTEEFPEP